MMSEYEALDKIQCEILSDEVMNQDLLFKLIIIGTSGVGKTCLLLRAVRNEFKDEYEVTIGVEFSSISLKLNTKLVKLQIWDTAGQEQYR